MSQGERTFGQKRQNTVFFISFFSVAKLFAEIVRLAPCFVLFDECDSYLREHFTDDKDAAIVNIFLQELTNFLKKSTADIFLFFISNKGQILFAQREQNAQTVVKKKIFEMNLFAQREFFLSKEDSFYANRFL